MPTTNYHRIIIKIGTSTMTSGTHKLSLPRLVELVQQIAEIHSTGCQLILVTSGGIAAGREALNFVEFPKFVPAKQMLSSIGQPRLMNIYTQLFQLYGKTVSQILLTRADLSDRQRYLNARNTLHSLLSYGIIPIINENDTVATEEIRFGDNDNLSAMAANLIEADLLILLTDQEGLFTSDPRRDDNAALVKEINTSEIPEELWNAAGGSNSGLGTGGMFTKLQAADLARRSGTTVIIANGRSADVILKIAHGEVIGTRLLPVLTKLESRKRYLLAGIRSAGSITIDNGAVHALSLGGSLLPVGMVEVKGKFERGDTVRVVDFSKKEIAIGLVNYAAKDLAHICKHHSDEIESILGYTFGDEVIHRDNLMML